MIEELKIREDIDDAEKMFIGKIVDSYIEAAFKDASVQHKEDMSRTEIEDKDFYKKVISYQCRISDIPKNELIELIDTIVGWYKENRQYISCETYLGSINCFEMAGHDLYLTRNCHGAGFWDDDWREPEATILADSAHALGEKSFYISFWPVFDENGEFQEAKFQVSHC